MEAAPPVEVPLAVQRLWEKEEEVELEGLAQEDAEEGGQVARGERQSCEVHRVG